MDQASRRSGAAAEAYEQYKRDFLGTAAECQRQGLSFIPMIAEPSGGWGPSGLCTLKALSRAAVARTNEEPSRFHAEQLQSLCTVIRRGHARAVMRRDPGAADVAGDALNGALSILADSSPGVGV